MGGRISTVLKTVLVVLLIISVYSTSVQFLPPALAQSGGTSVLYVSPISSSSAKPNSSFMPSLSLAVNLNLSSADSVSGYDIYMSYNSTVLDATGVQMGDLFPTGTTVNATYCVNDIGYNCLGYDSINIVHLSIAYTGGTVPGPSTYTVFTVQFSVLKIGHSFFQLFNGTTGSPNVFGAVDSSGLPASLSVLTWNGVYSNDGLQAFFNVSPDILLVNNPVYFDASASFNPENSSSSYRSGLSYNWDFGDGSTGNGVTVSHYYTSKNNYDVSLVVTDTLGNSSIVSRTVVVVPALGVLVLSIKDQKGEPVRNQSVILALYNSSILVETLASRAGTDAQFRLSELIPGTYRLDFSGQGITPASKQETVIAGVTRTDVIFLDVHAPTPPDSSPDVWTYLIVGIIMAILILGTLDVMRERSRKRRRRL